MTAGDLTWTGGFVLGLLSTLHCATMCSGVCGRAVAMLDPHGARSAFERLGLLNLGRLIVYSLIGAATGAFGAWFVPSGASTTFLMLHWLTALSLIWIGFVTAGLVPRVAILDTAFVGASNTAAAVLRPVMTYRFGSPLALGVLWGLSACPMVYGAAFLASLTASASAGALFMVAFGLGTLPGVVVGGAAINSLTQSKYGDAKRFAAGAAIATAGFLSIYIPPSQLLMMCVTN